MTAPIALFVYNRPLHTRQTVEALQRNYLASESHLHVFSDAPRDATATAGVRDVRLFLRSIAGFGSVTVIERDHNWGLDSSVIDGVTTLCRSSGRVIAMEDDLVTARWFLTYMNRALDLYANDDRVMQVAGHMFPIEGFESGRASFLPYTSSWGWGTWKRAWDLLERDGTGYDELRADRRKRSVFNRNGAYDHFDLLHQFVEGKTTAWDIQWYLTAFRRGGLTLYPNNSLVRNIGLDGSGEHCDSTTIGGDRLEDREITGFPDHVEVNVALSAAQEAYLHEAQGHTLWYFLRYVWMRNAKKRLLGEFY